MKKYLFTSIFILSCLSIISFASPTLYGPTGLIGIPTAEALKYKEFNFAFDYNQEVSSGNANAYFYKLNIGTFKSWELGIIGGTQPEDGVYVNAKYYLMSDNNRYPLSLAIGIQNLSSKTAANIYLVASKRFKSGLSGHLGFSYDIAEEDATLMTGLEFFLNNQLSLLGDLSGEKKEYVINAGLRYYLSSEFHVRASVLDIGSDELSYSVGISYDTFL